MRKAAWLLAALLASACASHVERELRAVNEQAKQAPGNCQDHVREVARLAGDRFTVKVLYTSSQWMGQNHVSAYVETSEGPYVLDNGALRHAEDTFPFRELQPPAWFSLGRVPPEGLRMRYKPGAATP